MAQEPTSFSASILGVSDIVESGLNKTSRLGNLNQEGAVGDKIDVLDLPMTDEELLKLRDEWEGLYAPYEARIKPTFQRNLRSYLGRLKDGRLLEEDQPGAANLQFESEETFLPAALARNPDPLVYSDNSPEGNKQSEDVHTMLQFHADQLLLKRKLAVMVRQWSIYQLGVLKPGWNSQINDVALDNRKIQDFVFDPNGFVDVYGHFSSWLGERITISADKLIELYPEHRRYIEEQVMGDNGPKLGTEVIYTQWWTDEFCFTTFKRKVLEKHKNEFFKYPDPNAEADPVTGEVPKPKNHFPVPLKPYIFLSVFSLQERPHDITGLIEQNIPNQAKISKRVEQIDDNVSQSNNGLAFSENNFNQETATQAANALTKGAGKVLVPQGGPIGEAIVRVQAPSFPESGFRDLENSENHLRSSWGVQGITADNPKESKDQTARGMVMNQGRDTSRIGGGVSEVVEQSVARSVFNWLTQLYYVFYDEKHFASVMGVNKATEYVELSNRDLNRQLIVSVAPNSMKPKDEITKMNQATDLFIKGAIGPKTLLETLDFPNPDESAADGVLWQVDKGAYIQMNFPELAQQLQAIAQAQQQAQMQAQQQQMAQEVAVHQQGLQQKGAEHEQKMKQGQEMHEAKVNQFKDMASAKLAKAT